MEISLKKMVLAEQEISEKEDIEQHLHKKGRTGASNLGNCVALRSWKTAGLPLPEISGLKADTSVFPLGKVIHEYIQKRAKEYCKKNGLFGTDEVLICVPLTKNTMVESPIDFVIASENVFIQSEIQFKNKLIPMNQCNDMSKVLKIFDVKSCSEYTYWKTLKEGASFHWIAQFLPYMKATHQNSLTILLYYKPKGWMEEVEVQWNSEVWDKVVKMQERVEELTIGLIANPEKPNFKESDLEYLTEEEPICWYSCPFSKTREEIAESGKPSLILEKPCDFACQFLKKQAMEKFAVGQKWKRGPAKITIASIVEETITSVNMLGKEYTDSIYYALKKFALL